MAKTFKIVFPIFPVAQGRYGSGGWGRSAKHRPQPQRCEIVTDDVVFTTGKSVIVQGQRKVKCNIWEANNGTLVRADYDTKTDGWDASFGLSLRKINTAAKQAAANKAQALCDVALKAAASVSALPAQPKLAEALALQAVIESVSAEAVTWVAKGCMHPVVGLLLAAKNSSGAGWSQFARAAATHAQSKVAA